MTAIKKNLPTSDVFFHGNEQSEKHLFNIYIDHNTAILIEEIRGKFTKETHASIVSKAIRHLHDQTCRTLIRTF